MFCYFPHPPSTFRPCASSFWRSMDDSPRKSTIATRTHFGVLWTRSSSRRIGRSPTAPPPGACPRDQRLLRFAPKPRQRAAFCCKTRRDLREKAGSAPRIEFFSAHRAIPPIATPCRAMLSNRPLPKYPNAKLKNPRARRGLSSAGANPWCRTTHGEVAPPDRSGEKSRLRIGETSIPSRDTSVLEKSTDECRRR
jgi:hypothetical protein